MKEITFEESRKILLNTLASIDKCCRDNDIKYSLSWGTLIGAIRHKGFIPWDDDMDLMMSRENYNKFIKCYNDSQYNLYMPRENNDFYHILAKVSNKDTAIYYDFRKKSPHGLWISIFPFDNVPDERNKQWELHRKIVVGMYHGRTSVWNTKIPLYRNLMKDVYKFILRPFKPYTIYRWVEKCLTKYNGQITKEIAIWDCGCGYTTFFKFPSELFEEYIDVPFANVNCMVIKGYDRFLRLYYGDYMQMPPEEQRVASHNYKAYYVDD